MLAWSISRILSDKQQAATCSLVMDLALGLAVGFAVEAAMGSTVDRAVDLGGDCAAHLAVTSAMAFGGGLGIV